MNPMVLKIGAVILLLVACSAPEVVTPPMPTAPGNAAEKIVTLTEALPITLADGEVQLTFVKVVEDSRCPADAICVTGGQVKVLFALNFGSGDAKEFARTLGDLHEGDVSQIEVAGIFIRLVDVQPYPFSSQPRTQPWAVTVGING